MEVQRNAFEQFEKIYQVAKKYNGDDECQNTSF